MDELDETRQDETGSILQGKDGSSGRWHQMTVYGGGDVQKVIEAKAIAVRQLYILYSYIAIVLAT